MSKPFQSVSRRTLLTRGGLALMGAPVLLEGLGISRFVPEFAAKAPSLLSEMLALGEDSSVLIDNALRGGVALSRFSMAQAQQLKEEWTIITIKVFDQVDIGLLFALGKLNAAGEVVTAGLGEAEHPTVSLAKIGAIDGVPGGISTPAADFVTAALRMLQGKTDESTRDARKLCSNPRMKALRFNDWFGSMMYTGQSEVNYAIPSRWSADFPDNVAIQVAMNLKRPHQAVNHQLNCVFLDEQADLNAFLEGEGVVFSPMGYTTFMMGDHYDANNWPEDVNHVYRRMPGANAVVPVSRGFKVSQFVANFDRLIRKPGFIDLKPGAGNALLEFDKFVDKSGSTRRGFIERRAALIDSLTQLEGLDVIERTKLSQAEFNKYCAVQGGGRFKEPVETQVPETAVASKDFIAQCYFVAKAVEFEGKPLRNFNLFLNMADLDGKGFLSVRNGDAGKPRSYNYIEGTRQLAVGLNLLAHAIKGKRAIVNVITDACRKDGNGDGDTGVAILLGPKGAGDLADALYAADICLEGEFKAPTDKTSLRNYADLSESWGAASASAFKGAPTLSNWQYGVADYIIEKAGRLDARALLLSPVKLKRTS